MAALPVMSLPAVAIEVDGEPPVRFGTWCPWCETTHWHGAAGGGGHRVAHCAADPASPLLATGYDLDPVGTARTVQAIVPGGLMVEERRLHEMMRNASGSFRRVLIRYLLGLARADGSVLRKRTKRGDAWIFGADRWLIDETGRPKREGNGLIRLAAALYGVPAGIVAVRLLEAVGFERVDAEAAFAIERTIDEWVGRGAPSRPER